MGGLLGVSGLAVTQVFGHDDTITSGTNPVGSTATAIVTRPHDFAYGPSDSFARPTLTISVEGSAKPLFVGVAPAAEVDRYPAGAAVATVTDVEVTPFRLETENRAGTWSPRPPGEQSFWTASADGLTPLEWEFANGEYRIVMMNADGSPGVAADTRASGAPHR